jgi:hypothetical protein
MQRGDRALLAAARHDVLEALQIALIQNVELLDLAVLDADLFDELGEDACLHNVYHICIISFLTFADDHANRPAV